MPDNWFYFETSWGHLWVNATNVTDARTHAHSSWGKMLKSGGTKGVPPLDDHGLFATTEARAAQIRKDNEIRFAEEAYVEL